jgi:hypothetical protein
LVINRNRLIPITQNREPSDAAEARSVRGYSVSKRARVG